MRRLNHLSREEGLQRGVREPVLREPDAEPRVAAALTCARHLLSNPLRNGGSEGAAGPASQAQGRREGRSGASLCVRPAAGRGGHPSVCEAREEVFRSTLSAWSSQSGEAPLGSLCPPLLQPRPCRDGRFTERNMDTWQGAGEVWGANAHYKRTKGLLGASHPVPPRCCDIFVLA